MEFTYQKGCWTEGPWWNRTTKCDYRTRFDRREIVIREWNEDDDAANQSVIDAVYHEIGHNYDNGQWQSSTWNNFLSLSGWVRNPKDKTGLFVGADFSSGKTTDPLEWYRSTNDRSRFASDYAGTSAREDWAEAWELYFHTEGLTESSNSVLTSKMRLVQKMVLKLA